METKQRSGERLSTFSVPFNCSNCDNKIEQSRTIIEIIKKYPIQTMRQNCKQFTTFKQGELI
ncbi:MAG: hypothetical protein Q7R52_02400 [archaeon]|nr:hypothetical protein [archaeon]